MSSRSASALLDAALAVPFDPEEEDRRQLALAAQAQWESGPLPDQQLDIAPEAVDMPPPLPQIAPDPLVVAADASMDQGLEPALPQADEDLPPVTPPQAGSMEQGARQGGGRRSASALLADVQEPGAGSGQPGGGGQRPDAGGQTTSRRSASALLADVPEAAPVNVEGQSILGTIGNAFKRGWTMGDLARELEAPQPNADRVFALQSEMRKLPPSPEYVTTMRDDVSPAESWQAFKSNPVGVLGELMGESLSAFANQMIEKAPNRVAIGLGAGAALGAPVVGIGAVPGGFMGAGAGFAEASGAASYALEMSSGILEALERSGVPMDDPAAMRAALADPERMQVAREFAQRKAVPIAIFDGGSALIAGRLGGKSASALAKVGEGFAETFIQGAMGAAGEASGQLAQSGQITSGRGILAEGVAEVPTGLVEIGAGALTQDAADANRPGMTAAPAPAASAPGIEAPWQAAREQAAPTVTRVEVVADDVFGEPTTAAVERPVATGDERFAPPPAAAEQPAPAAGSTASVPVMITRQMEADLLARGISQQEINAMTPQQANEILAGAGQRTAGPAVPTGETTDAGDGAATGETAGAVEPQMADRQTAAATPAAMPEARPRRPRKDLLGREISAEQLAFNEQFLLSGVVDPSLTSTYATDFPNMAAAFAEQQQAIGGPSYGQSGRGVVRVYPRQGARLSTENEFTLPQDAQPVAEFTPAQVRAGEHLQWFADQRTAAPAVPTETATAPAPAAAPTAQSFPELVKQLKQRGATDIKQYGPDTSTRVVSRDTVAVSAVEDGQRYAYFFDGDQIVRRRETTPDAEPAPVKANKRIKSMTAQSGAIDLSIVEDLVEYGRTVYRAGMDFATWSAQMTREFGQRVAQFLRQAFDRIVAAYQASRFSDTTGAVGDVRPKAKPRQFEAKAARNEALAPETRARLGSEYIPISLNAQATEAKDWINTNGLEAAKLRIAQLSGNDTVPTPLDFAIGIEAAGRLSATGDHAGAAGIVSTMSQRATSLGQTISVLAMMARLTPEGIVLYGQNIVSRYINTLPQEAQDRIKALQAEVDRLRTALADMKFKEGSEVIRSGKLGDEKIQDRIKRRVKARVSADLGPDATGPQVTAETKARTQGLNRRVRDVLLSDAKQAEMTKEITQILTSQGNMPAAEAEAVAKSIVGAFTKIVTATRRNYVTAVKRGGGARKAKADALLKMLTTQREMTDAEFVSEISQLMGLPGMTPALARELRALGQRYENATDPDVKLVLAAQMFERAHEVVPTDFWVKVRGFAYLSMLFAPKTWIRNVIGNQIQWIFNVGRDAVVSGIMDPAMSLLTGKRTSAGLKLGARLRGLLAPAEDVRRGYLANKQFNPEANFRQNFMAGVNHLRMLSKLTTQNKFEIADVRDVGGRIFSSKAMRLWEGTLSIALGAGDRAFWMSQFRASLAQMQAAAEKNGEWTGQPTPEMIEAAMAEAAYAIYQNQNIISANANKIRGALNRLTTFGKTDQYGLGTGLMAFTQVPGSITLRGLIEWSPLGMIPALYRGMRGILYATAGGRIGAKFDQAAFNKEFTQALVGTGALYAAGYYLYALGIVSASREDDDDLEAMRRASGGGAYRINLTALRRALLSGNWFTRQEGEEGDLIVPYDWAQPVAITFAAGAELAAQVERSSREQLKKGLAEKAGMAALSLAAGAKSLEELPLLSGLSSFIKTWGYSGPLEATTATVAGMPSQFVPQLVRQAGQMNDNFIRETRGGDSVVQREFMRILASVPGYSTKFPLRFDITGQAIQRYQYGGNSVMNVFFSPAMASEFKRNSVLQEVSRLVDATGDAGVVPRQVKRSTRINGVDVDLTNEQLAAYSYYLGNFTMSHFAWRMAAPVYAQLPDEMKVKMLAQDITDIDAAVKSAVLGADPRRLTRTQMFLRQALVNSPLGRSVPPR